MNVKKIKAYSVQDYESGCIVFASNSATARREGANNLGCEWEDIESCRRVQWADEYADERRVPPLTMIEHGWWFECCNCGERVGEDSCSYDDDDNEIRHKPVACGDLVYCTQECLDSERREREAAQAHHDAAIQAATDAWPGVSVIWVGTKRGVDGTSVSFTFPGGEHSVDWVVGEKTVLIRMSDVDAWSAFKAHKEAA